MVKYTVQREPTLNIALFPPGVVHVLVGVVLILMSSTYLDWSSTYFGGSSTYFRMSKTQVDKIFL